MLISKKSKRIKHDQQLTGAWGGIWGGYVQACVGGDEHVCLKRTQDISCRCPGEITLPLWGWTFWSDSFKFYLSPVILERVKVKDSFTQASMFWKPLNEEWFIYTTDEFMGTPFVYWWQGQMPQGPMLHCMHDEPDCFILTGQLEQDACWPKCEASLLLQALNFVLPSDWATYSRAP